MRVNINAEVYFLGLINGETYQGWTFSGIPYDSVININAYPIPQELPGAALEIKEFVKNDDGSVGFQVYSHAPATYSNYYSIFVSWTDPLSL